MISYLFVALAIAVASFMAFRKLYLRTDVMWRRASLAVVAFVLAAPAVLFSSNYLLDVPYQNWFVNFHSLPGAEASSGLVGALLGVMFASARLRPNCLNTPVLTISTAVALMLLVAPFGKQLLYSQDYSKLENRWNHGVCQQTSSSTCVPASCATVVKMLGGSVTERELAKEAGTNRRGTEMWYMMRALRRHGFTIQAHDVKSLKDALAPSILGVMVGDAGHAVVLMSKTSIGPEIADPIGLRRSYTWSAFEKKYRPKPVYYVIRPICAQR